MNVMEHVPLGTGVGRVQAFDKDVGQNALFEYAITHANIGRKKQMSLMASNKD